METTNTEMNHRSMEGFEQRIKGLEAEVARQRVVIQEQNAVLHEHKEAIEGLIDIIKKMNIRLWGVC